MDVLYYCVDLYIYLNCCILIQASQFHTTDIVIKNHNAVPYFLIYPAVHL